MPRNPSEESIGLEHIIAVGTAFTGVVPQKAYADTYTILGGTQGAGSPTTIPNRSTFVVNRPDDTLAEETSGGTATSGNGLFDPYDVFDVQNGKHLWLTGIQVIDPSGLLEWDVFVTSGLNDGSATTLDAVAGDAAILSGTGATFQRIGLELFQNRRIRVTTDNNAAVGDARIALFFTYVNGSFGRLY